ncbi:MAG: hypothetical protein WBE11_19505 [Candidatus Aminicenantaceae bacterium]
MKGSFYRSLFSLSQYFATFSNGIKGFIFVESVYRDYYMAKTLQAHPFDTSDPNYYAIRSHLTVLINFTPFAQLTMRSQKIKGKHLAMSLSWQGKIAVL